MTDNRRTAGDPAATSTAIGQAQREHPAIPGDGSDPVADAAATVLPRSAISDFGIDTTSRSTGEAVRDYLSKVRGGELGVLPALLGLAVLLVAFSALSGYFLTLNN
ncbi:MAG: hypothetical protein ACRDRL_23945, partial [Sciscionella sp.]